MVIITQQHPPPSTRQAKHHVGDVVLNVADAIDPAAPHARPQRVVPATAQEGSQGCFGYVLMSVKNLQQPPLDLRQLLSHHASPRTLARISRSQAFSNSFSNQQLGSSSDSRVVAARYLV